MPVSIFDETNSGSSCYLLTSKRDEDTHLPQSKFYFVVVNEHLFSNFSILAGK